MNEISVSSVFDNLVGYFKTLPDFDYSIYLILFSLLTVWVAALLIMAFTKFNNVHQIYFRKQLSYFYALIIGCTLLMGFTVWCTHFNSFIFINSLQSVIILLTLSYLFFIVHILNFLFKHLKQRKTEKIGVFSGMVFLGFNTGRMFLFFRKIRWLYLIIIVPFLLLFINPIDKNLYSFIFDNSGSMELYNQQSVEAIGSISANLKENSHFIVSHIPSCSNMSDCEKLISSLKKDIGQIIASGKDKELASVTSYFLNKTDFFNYIEYGILDSSGLSSPIYECIWDNYRNALSLDATFKYKNKFLIILTDGEDNLYFNEEGMIKPQNCLFQYGLGNNTIESFYDEITFINYSDYMRDMFITCNNYRIIEGNNSDNLDEAIMDQFKLIYFDKELLVILISFFIFGLLFIVNLK